MRGEFLREWWSQAGDEMQDLGELEALDAWGTFQKMVTNLASCSMDGACVHSPQKAGGGDLGELEALDALGGVYDGLGVLEKPHGVAQHHAAAPLLLQAARLQAQPPARLLQAPAQRLYLGACPGTGKFYRVRFRKARPNRRRASSRPCAASLRSISGSS